MIGKLVIALAVSTAVACSGQQDQGENRSKPGQHHREMMLSLRIRADQQPYGMRDTVSLEVQLTNVGHETVYLYDDACWNPGNFLTIHVFNPDHKEVSGTSDFLRDCLPPPPKRDDTSSFLKLEPGTFYGVVENFTVRELVPSPGDYDIAVYYEAALTEDWIARYGGAKVAALPVWTRDQPLLTSNRLHISVKP